MEGLINESKKILDENMNNEVKDVAFIATGQKIEYYEIALHSCALTYARILERQDIEDLLEQTLNEERKTNDVLNEISCILNLEAIEESENDAYYLRLKIGLSK